MIISLINQELDERMVAVESKKNDIVVARELLEEALTFQFQRLALGLCSFASLYGNALSNNCINPLRSYFSQKSENISIEELRQKISMGVLLRQWEIISISQFNSIEIRLFNKRVKLWNDIEINEQLALLGSSLRFYFVGSDQLTIAHIKSLVEYKSNQLALDGRFIFGNIGNVSATYFGPLFYFINEVAVSPYFSESEPGFTVRDTTILRDVALKGISKDHALTHELLHAFGYGFKDGLPFGVANWRRWIERDICRFLINSHTYQEIEESIGKYQKIADSLIDLMLQHNEVDYTKFQSLEFCDLHTIFDDLIKKKWIIKEDNNKYYSPVYRRGTKWVIY